MSDELNTTAEQAPAPKKDEYVEFEIGKHPIPWFLWVLFVLIVSWAAISWIPFFGY